MRKKISKLILVIILCFSLLLTPVFAQTSSKEAVEIDGRILFEVVGYDLFTAEVRADWIHSQIKAVVESKEKPQITIKTQNKLPIIILNERYLLTVTAKDTSSEIPPQEQAKIWADQITQAIEKAQKERNIYSLDHRFVLTTILLILLVVIHWFLGRIWQRSHSFWLRIFNLDRNNSESKINQILNLGFSCSLLFIRVSLWVIVLLYIANLFPLTRSWSYQIRDRLRDSFTMSLISIGNNSYSLLDFLILVALEIALLILANAIVNFLLSRVLILTQINRGVREAIAIVVKYIFIFIGTVVLLQVWGFDLTSLICLEYNL